MRERQGQFAVNSQTHHSIGPTNTFERVDISHTKPLFLLQNTLLGKCYNVTPLAAAEPQGSSKDQGTIDDLMFLSHQNHDSDRSCVKCQKLYQVYVNMDCK